jgi:hypothetical protein
VKFERWLTRAESSTWSWAIPAPLEPNDAADTTRENAKRAQGSMINDDTVVITSEGARRLGKRKLTFPEYSDCWYGEPIWWR